MDRASGLRQQSARECCVYCGVPFLTTGETIRACVEHRDLLQLDPYYARNLRKLL